MLLKRPFSPFHLISGGMVDFIILIHFSSEMVKKGSKKLTAVPSRKDIHISIIHYCVSSLNLYRD